MVIITLLFYAVVVFCLLRIVYILATLLEIQRREEHNHAQIRQNQEYAEETKSEKLNDFHFSTEQIGNEQLVHLRQINNDIGAIKNKP